MNWSTVDGILKEIWSQEDSTALFLEWSIHFISSHQTDWTPNYSQDAATARLFTAYWTAQKWQLDSQLCEAPITE